MGHALVAASLPAPQAFLPGAPSGAIQAAEATTRENDVAVRDIIAQAFDRAVDILKSRRADLDRGAEMLLTRETISADDFPAIRPVSSEEAAPQPAPIGTLVW